MNNKHTSRQSASKDTKKKKVPYRARLIKPTLQELEALKALREWLHELPEPRTNREKKYRAELARYLGEVLE